VSPLNETREEQPHASLKITIVRPRVNDSGIVRVGTRERSTASQVE
jgi:hypothetical protein